MAKSTKYSLPMLKITLVGHAFLVLFFLVCAFAVSRYTYKETARIDEQVSAIAQTLSVQELNSDQIKLLYYFVTVSFAGHNYYVVGMNDNVPVLRQAKPELGALFAKATPAQKKSLAWLTLTKEPFFFTDVKKDNTFGGLHFGTIVIGYMTTLFIVSFLCIGMFTRMPDTMFLGSLFCAFYVLFVGAAFSITDNMVSTVVVGVLASILIVFSGYQLKTTWKRIRSVEQTAMFSPG